MSQNADTNSPLLAKVKKDLSDQKIMAFLGPVNSGKTVMAALLNDALFKFFAPKKPDCHPQLVSGFEYLESVRNAMFDGNFPSPTEGTKPPVEFKIRLDAPIQVDVTMYVYDMSGEDYHSLLASKDLSAKERLDGILRKRKDRAEPYGPMSFIAVSKMYAIIVDCDAYSDWGRLDLEYANTLNSLSQLQTAQKQNKLEVPLAIVLTKTDRLPGSDSEKDAETLFKDNMPQFYTSLKTIHSGALEYFKFHIETGRDASNVAQPNKIKIPWSYSSDEYVRFIEWVLQNA